MLCQKLGRFLIAFNLVIIRFHNIRNADAVPIGAQRLLKSRDSFRMTENLGRPCYNAYVYRSLSPAAVAPLLV